MSNLKLDIIYYKTSSDFEMEFNLNGCCRMRIFKEKVETAKDLVKTLARDVSRSKIIIVVTDLIGAQNGVEIVSKAIGLPLTPIDKEEFGIQSEDDIMIPQNAVPLINNSGIYGGCILESGPQSIILISSFRALRHEIMKAYIHNYVFDIAQIEAYNERMANSANSLVPPIAELYKTPTPQVQPVEQPSITEDDEEEPNVEEAAEQTPAENTEAAIPEDVIEENFAEEINEEPDANDNSLFIVSDNASSPGFKPELNFIDNITSDSIPLNTSPTSHRKHKKKNGLNITLLILAILLLICVGVLAYFFIYIPLTGAETSYFAHDNFITEFLKECFLN